MTTFYIEYRVKGYSLADAFRPNPKWGKRAFYADSDKLGTDDIEAVKEAAIATAPDGYEFFSIEALHRAAAQEAAEQKGGENHG
jgi:LAS superfamily LD-carboxypeptidase LdcB